MLSRESQRKVVRVRVYALKIGAGIGYETGGERGI